MIHSHMSKLSGLRKLFDTIDIQVGSLKNLSYEPCRYGPLLILIIASKIPNNLNLIISRKFDSADDWDIEIVLNTLKTEIITREKTVLVSKQGQNVQQEYFREPVTGFTLFSHQKKSISCLFCKKPKKNQNSSIVSDIRKTKKFVKTSKCCFAYLRGSHLARDCSLKIKYFKSSERHHVAF